MKMKHFTVALCITTSLLYFSYRGWKIAQKEPELQVSTVTVTPGRYYLDDGTQTAYLDISECNAEAQTFELTYHNMDLEDLKIYLLDSNYHALTEWDIKCDDTGEIIYDENGEYSTYTAEECEQINQENFRQIRESINAWCAETAHTYCYSQPTDMYLYADWYNETGKDGNDPSLTTFVMVFSDKIIFEDYIWKFEPTQEEK